MGQNKLGEFADYAARVFDFAESREEMQNYVVENHGLKHRSLEEVDDEGMEKMFASFKLKEATENGDGLPDVLSSNERSKETVYNRGYLHGQRDLMEENVVWSGDHFDSGKSVIDFVVDQYEEQMEEQYGNDDPYRHKPDTDYSGQIGGVSASSVTKNDFSGWENRAGKREEMKNNE